MHKTHTEVRSFYSGLILGDATIDNGVSKRALRISSINKDFLDYVKAFTDSYTPFKNYIRLLYKPYTDGNGVNRKETYEFVIKAHPYFRKLYPYFYNDYRKRIISNVTLQKLDLQGFANWYMSDGYVCQVGKAKGFIKDCRVDLCTDRYSLDNINKAVKYITNVLGYRANIIKRKANNKYMYRIRINVIDAQRMFLDIDKFVVPSMKYKLIMPYSKEKSWMLPEYKSLMSNLISASTINENSMI